MACEGKDEGGMSDVRHRIEDDAWALFQALCQRDPLVFLEAILTLEVTVNIDPDPTYSRIHGPLSMNPIYICLSPSHDPAILSCRTPSVTWSASPVLMRRSSNGSPTTPTNSHPSSPFTLAFFSPHPDLFERFSLPRE